MTCQVELKTALCKALGLEIDRLLSAQITLVPNDVIKIQAEYWTGEIADGELVKEMRNYKLVREDE